MSDIQQRIEKILRKYENDHKSKIYSYHESTRKELKKDVEAVRSELTALLLAVQDEQKEKAKQKVSQLGGKVEGSIFLMNRDSVYEAIGESEYAYNPDKL